MSHGTKITIVDPAGYVKQAMACPPWHTFIRMYTPPTIFRQGQSIIHRVRGSAILHPWHDCKDFDPAGHI